MKGEEEMEQIGLLSEHFRTSTKGNEVSKLSQFLLDLGFCARAFHPKAFSPIIAVPLSLYFLLWRRGKWKQKARFFERPYHLSFAGGGERPLSANSFLHRLTYLGEGGEP